MNISGLAAAPVAVVCYGNYRRVSIYTVVLLERKKTRTILSMSGTVCVCRRSANTFNSMSTTGTIVANV